MAEYIDREAAKRAVKHIPWCDWEAVGESLDSIPAADVEVVVHSNWEIIDVDHGHGRKGYHCPECDFEDWRYESTKRCPNCGCKMDLGG